MNEDGPDLPGTVEPFLTGLSGAVVPEEMLVSGEVEVAALPIWTAASLLKALSSPCALTARTAT